MIQDQAWTPPFTATTTATAASAGEAITGTNTTKFVTPAALAGSVPTLAAPLIAGSASRSGIISTGASAVGTTQDNTGLAFGTGNLTPGLWVRLPDWTPASAVYLFRKYASNIGLGLYVNTDGSLRLEVGNGASATTYVSTAVTGLADGAWAFIAVSIDRSGNAVFYVNGAQLGTAVVISALSAQTFTSTAALTWLSYGGGHYAGTLGETFIVSGLLTATNIADIYRAGSIAPFSASFTFFQWCDFGQGYGPIIKDRSGQNQPALMGTSGLSHAVPRNPPGVPQRAPRVALVGDGSNGSLIRSTLGTQNPSTGEFVLMWDGVYPTETGNTDRALMALSSSSSTNVSARSFVVTKRDDLGFLVNLYGATGGVDYRYRASLALHNALKAYAGRVSIWVTRTKVYVGIAGDLFDVSNLFTADVTAGSPPAWTDQVDGQYLLGFYTNSTASSAASLFDLRLANVAMTEAQLRTEYERGEPGAEWQRGSKVGLVTGDDSTFASDTGFWTKGNAATISGGKANLTGGANSNIAKVLLVPLGQKARLTVTVDTGDAAAYVTDGNITITISAATFGGGTTGTKTIEFTGGPTWGFQIVSPSGTLVLDNLSLELLGYTARLRTDTAAGLTALDGSTNKNDFLLSTTGVTTSPNGRVQTIRATTNTSGNQQLAGASLIDTTKRWRIHSWNINSSGTPTVSLGNVSAGAQYLSGSALTATNNEVTLLTRIPGTANLWCNANSTATLEHTVVLEQVD